MPWCPALRNSSQAAAAAVATSAARPTRANNEEGFPLAVWPGAASWRQKRLHLQVLYSPSECCQLDTLDLRLQANSAVCVEGCLLPIPAADEDSLLPRTVLYKPQTAAPTFNANIPRSK